jgi:hypothetical protein
MPIYGRHLILVIGGNSTPGEKLKGYLRRVSKITGIGHRSLELAWRGRYESKNTKLALQAAAQEKAKNDDGKIIAAIESGIAFLEAVDAGFHRPHIDAGRQFLAAYRDNAETGLFAPVPKGPDDGDEE